jgi:hypothetical protein
MVRKPGTSEVTMDIHDDPLTQAEYILALSVIRRTLIDALNCHGLETLTGLFFPLPQAAIGLMLGADPETAFQRTLTVCQRLTALDDNTRKDVRHALRWYGVHQIKEVWK